MNRFAVFFIMGPWVIAAAPKAPEVIRGEARFQQIDDATLHIDAADRTVIHWNEFSIERGELARFALPSSDGAVLNRVMGPLPSTIAGTLESNGIVYLINPAGILVDKTGSINTAGFIASTLDALDVDFLAKGPMNFQGISRASVVNLGTINANDGDLFLIGYAVNNEGSLSAPRGTAGIGAGLEVAVAPSGEQRLAVKLQLPEERGEGGVHDTGALTAKLAEIKADGTLYTHAIRHEGTIQAMQVEEKGGKVFLVAEQGLVAAAGSLTGKEVNVLGEQVGLFGVNIAAPEGEVYVGGGFQGKDESRLNAQNTFVSADSFIDVSGQEKGGKAVFWADRGMFFSGSVNGTASKEGGDVEVSGKDYMEYDGHVNLMAEMPGTLLLDPTSIEIGGAAADVNTVVALGNAGAGLNTNYVVPVAPENPVGAAAAGRTRMLVASIFGAAGALATANVVIATSKSDNSSLPAHITLLDGFPATHATNANSVTFKSAGDVRIYSALSMTAGGHITLDAAEDVFIGPSRTSAAVTAASALIASGGALGQGNITVQAGRSIRHTNGFTGNSAISSTNGHISMTALTGDIEFRASPTNAGGSLSVTATSASVRNVTIHALQGNIILQGGDAAGNSVTVNSTSGVVNLTAMGTTGIRLLAGTGTTSHVNVTTPGAAGVLLMNAPNADIRMAAGQTAASTGLIAVTSANLLELHAGKELHFVGGAGAGGAGAPTNVVVTGTNTASFEVGGGMRMIGGSTTASSVLFTSNNYVSGTVGGSLLMQGGTGTTTFAVIRSVGSATVTGSINVSVGLDLTMESGTAQDSYVQIGNHISSVTNAHIFISKVGGNLSLRSNATGATIRSYAVIGHGSFAGGISPTVAGDIIFAEGVGGNIILQAGNGTGTNTFAQIGHLGGLAGGTSITGNIKINDFDNYLTMSPGLQQQALIGHGTLSLTPVTITGQIEVTSVSGSLFMNPTAGATAATITQIGHLLATNTVGGIRIDVGGPMEMASSPFAGSISLIGHGTTTTPAGASFSGQLRVSSESMRMIAGNAITTTTQVGFFGGSIVPASPQVTNINVIAERDILLQGGQGIAGAGNTAIGYISGAVAVNVVLDNILVQSLNGNITLAGGSGDPGGATGIALIGSLQGGVGIPTILTSRVAVLAPNGTVSLRGVASPNAPAGAGPGYARITNGNGGPSSPFDVVIEANNFHMLGSDSTAAISGSAVLQSTRDLIVRAQNDIQLVAGTSTNAGAFFPVHIQTFAGSGAPFQNQITMEAGNNFIMRGGTALLGGLAVGVLIEPLFITPNQQATVSLKAANDFIARAGTNTNQSIAIGMRAAGIPVGATNAVLDVSVEAGRHVLLQGGSGGTAVVSLMGGAIGATGVTATGTIQAGGDITLLGGNTAAGGQVIVGPSSMTMTTQTARMSVTTGGSLNLLGGPTGSTQSVSLMGPAFGAATANQQVYLSMDIGQDLVMQGGPLGTTTVTIGPSTTGVSGGSQGYYLTGRIGRNFTMLGGTTTTTTVGVGALGVTGLQCHLGINLDVGGDFTILGNAGPMYFGMPLASALSGARSDFLMNLNVGGNMHLAAGATAAATADVAFGVQSIAAPGINMNAVHRINVAGSAVFEGGSSGGVGATGNALVMGPTVFSGANSSHLLSVQTGGDLQIRQLDSSTNLVLINSAPMTAANQIMTTSFDAGNDLVIDLGSSTGGTMQIGPGGAGMTGTFNYYLHSFHASGDIRIVGSSSGGGLQKGPTTVTGANSGVDWILAAEGNLDIQQSSGGSLFLGSGFFPSGLNCNFGTWNQQFVAGGDMTIRSGTATAFTIGPMEVGTGGTTTDQQMTLVFDAGKNLSIQGPNTGAGFFTIIGPFTASGPRAIVDFTFKSGNDLLIQHNTGATSNFYVGGTGMSGLNQTYTAHFDAGGHMMVNAGSATSINGVGQSAFFIGPQAFGTTGSKCLMHTKTGADCAIQGSLAASTPFSFGPGSQTGTNTVEMSFDIGGSLFLEGGEGAASSATIGIGSAGGTGQTGPSSVFSLSIDAAHDIVLRGGRGATSPAFLGASVFSAGFGSHLVNIAAGGDIVLFGGPTGTNSFVSIGPVTNGSFTGNCAINIQASGDMLMKGGTTGGGTLIGAMAMSNLVNNLTIGIDLDGSLIMDGSQIAGGVAANSICQIGPVDMSQAQQTVDVSVKTGQDVMMFGSLNGATMLIGSTAFSAAGTNNLQTVNVSVEAGQSVHMHGAGITNIGMVTMGGTSNNLNVSVKAGSTLHLAGGTNSPAIIGATTVSGNDNVMNVNLYSGGQIACGTTNAPYKIGGTTQSGIGSAVNISVQSAGSAIFHSTDVSGFSNIGMETISGTSAINAIALNIGGDLSFLPTNEPTGGVTGVITVGPNTMSGVNNKCFISGTVGGNMMMLAGQGLGTNQIVVGPRIMSNSGQTAEVALDVGGSLSLMGGATFSSAHIGPLVMSAGVPNKLSTIAVKTGGDLLLRGGTAASAVAQIGPNTISGVSDQSTITVDVGGSITLDGNSSSGAIAALIGPNTISAVNFVSSTISVRSGGNVSLIGGTQNTSHAAIGHGTQLSIQGSSEVYLDVGGNLLLQGGTGPFAFAYIGALDAGSFTQNNITINRIGGSATLHPGTSTLTFPYIGLNSASGGSLFGDITIKEIVGDLTLGQAMPVPFVVYGTDSCAFIGHLGFGGAPINISGNINIERVGGTVTLRGTGSTGTGAYIALGSPESNPSDVISGRVVVNGSAFQLIGGAGVNAHAVIGAAPATGANVLNLQRVEVHSEGDVTLTTTGVGSAVIGYFGGVSTGTCTLSNVNVTAEHGNVTLTGTAISQPSVIGMTNAGTTIGNVKVTTAKNVFLSGNATITNSSGVAVPSNTLSIDPTSVILLGGSSLVSAGNLAIDFDDRFDHTFDSVTSIIQATPATVTANNNIYINTSAPSLGLITIQGPTAGTASITATTGDIFIGTGSATGAGNMNVGVAAAVAGPVSITGRDLIFNLGNDLALTTGTVGGSTTALTASRNVDVTVRGDISTSGTNAVTFTSGNGYMTLNAFGNVSAGLNSTTGVSGAAFPEDLTIIAGQDIRATSNAVLTAAASAGDVLLTAGRSFLASGTSITTTSQSVEVTAGNDISVSGNATVNSTGTGSVLLDAGRDINQSSAVAISSGNQVVATAARDVNNSTTISAAGTGSLRVAAGQSVTNSGTLTHSSGAVTVTAGQDVTNTNTITIGGGNGVLTVEAGQDVANSGTIAHAGSGSVAVSAAQDITNNGGNISTSGGRVDVLAGRNFSQFVGNVSVGGGNPLANPLYVNARGNVFITGFAIGPVPSTISNAVGGELHVIAGRNMTLSTYAEITGGTSNTSTNIVVDDLYPVPPNFYGRGFLSMDNTSSITGSELRIYTARQPWNSIGGALNGFGFVPGVQYTDTTIEIWDSYFPRTLEGVPYTVFYKDQMITIVPPVPPVPVPVPGSTTFTVAVPLIFWIAISEAFRDWSNYDVFLFDDVDFDMLYNCIGYSSAAGGSVGVRGSTASGGGASCSTMGNQKFKLLRQGYKNYHTKKLDTKL